MSTGVGFASKSRVVRRILPLVLLPVAASCNPTASGTIQLVTGEETDTFTQSPVPTQIRVDADDGSGNLTTIATASYPTDTIDLGNQDESAVVVLDVSALDANGNTLVYGQSVPLQYGALDGLTLPIFVQRVGQNARLPNPLGDSRQSPTMTVVSDRFLIVTGGSDPTTATSTVVYDFAQLQVLGSPPTLPHVPMSLPVVGTVGVVIDQNGAAYYDFSQDTSQELTAPSGFSFADVAGGRTVYDATDNLVFVVGATRTSGAPTAAVLKIDANATSNSSPVGNVSWLTLSAPRLGASAAWVDSHGLVVAGGSATGAGVEVVPVGETTGAPLPYPSDPSAGAGMTKLDATHVLLAGGVQPDGTDAGVRSLDLGCAQACGSAPGTQAWGALPVAITGATAFSFDPSRGFVVGNEATSGLTHTFLLTSAGATEVPTKVPHTNAAAMVSPLGTVVLFGGAPDLESFTPAAH
jgi:hypothetical protein